MSVEQLVVDCLFVFVCICVCVFKEEKKDREKKINRCSKFCLSIGYLKEKKGEKKQKIFLSSWVSISLRQVFNSIGNYLETSQTRR